MCRYQQLRPVMDLVYDVGMHRGEDTDYYLKKGYRVIAFEANPDLVKVNKKSSLRRLKISD